MVFIFKVSSSLEIDLENLDQKTIFRIKEFLQEQKDKTHHLYYGKPESEEEEDINKELEKKKMREVIEKLKK